MNTKTTALDLKLSSKEEYKRQALKEMFPGIKDIMVDFTEEAEEDKDNWSNWSLDMFYNQEEIV